MNFRVGDVHFKNMEITARDSELREEVREMILDKVRPVSKKANLTVTLRRYNDDEGNPIKYSTNIQGSVDGREVKFSKVGKKLMASVNGAAVTLQRSCRKNKNKSKDKEIKIGSKIKKEHQIVDLEIEPEYDMEFQIE